MEVMVTFRIGQQASAVQTVTEEVIAVISGLRTQSSVTCDEPAGSPGGSLRSNQDLLVASLVNNLLTHCLPGPGSMLLSQQFEYLAQIFPGDVLTARVEVTAWSQEKRLITLKTDCYNQAGRQVLTGQAVLVVTG
jgi:3-hydroxybutyryl-CoA dehydratase